MAEARRLATARPDQQLFVVGRDDDRQGKGAVRFDVGRRGMPRPAGSKIGGGDQQQFQHQRKRNAEKHCARESEKQVCHWNQRLSFRRCIAIRYFAFRFRAIPDVRPDPEGALSACTGEDSRHQGRFVGFFRRDDAAADIL